MKKYIHTAFSMMILLSLSLNGNAAAISDASIDKLLVLSGLEKQLEQMPNTVRTGITRARQKGGNIPDAEFNEVANIIASSFQPAVLTKAVRVELKSKMTQADAKEVLKWYESDAGNKIRKAEEKASTPEAYKAMIAEAKTLLADEKMLATAKRIEQALNSVDMAMKIQENTGVAVYTALVLSVEPNKKPDIDSFKANMAKQIAQARGRLEQFVYLTLIFSYKDVQPDVMKKYIAFLEKPLAKKYNQTIMTGMVKAIKQSTDLMGQDLANLFKTLRNKKGK